MPRISTITFTIRDLLEEVLNGSIQIPYLQRKFVWKPSQIAKLFDSILANLPIGTPIFVRYAPSLSIPHILLEGVEDWWNYHYGSVPFSVRHATPKYLVIDGQQRLISMLLALLPYPQETTGIISIPHNVLYEVDIRSSPPHISRRKRIFIRKPSIRKLGVPSTVGVWLHHFYGHTPSPASAPSVGGVKIVHKSSPHTVISSHLHTYQVTILEYIPGSSNELIQTFQHINKAGTPLSLFDLVAAQVVDHVIAVARAKSHPLLSSPSKSFFSGKRLHDWIDSLDKHLRSTVFSSKSRRTSRNRVCLKGTAGENAVLRSLSMIMDLYLSKPIKIYVPDDSYILSKLKSALTASSSVPASRGPTFASVPYRALDFAWMWNYTCISIQEAWKYLYNHFGVVDLKIIPYMTILPPLAVMLHYSSSSYLRPLLA